ncbi:hypothetical protein [Mesorhizobium neociceri]|uniref:hypothetical protein n=1 Tax=Mesorhizobium neociceri TaxID=1307853 RepID=UPI001F1FC9F5|nr:hypothetical protein [Mesorhizobium neociceri]
MATAALPGPAASVPVLNPANRNALGGKNELLTLENMLLRQQHEQQQLAPTIVRSRAATAPSTAHLPATAVGQRHC